MACFTLHAVDLSFGTESIESFTEDQAFSLSYDLAPSSLESLPSLPSTGDTGKKK
jgi:hypothetical protein